MGDRIVRGAKDVAETVGAALATIPAAFKAAYEAIVGGGYEVQEWPKDINQEVEVEGKKVRFELGKTKEGQLKVFMITEWLDGVPDSSQDVPDGSAAQVGTAFNTLLEKYKKDLKSGSILDGLSFGGFNKYSFEMMMERIYSGHRISQEEFDTAKAYRDRNLARITKEIPRLQALLNDPSIQGTRSERETSLEAELTGVLEMKALLESLHDQEVQVGEGMITEKYTRGYDQFTPSTFKSDVIDGLTYDKVDASGVVIGTYTDAEGKKKDIIVRVSGDTYVVELDKSTGGISQDRQQEISLPVNGRTIMEAYQKLHEKYVSPPELADRGKEASDKTEIDLTKVANYDPMEMSAW
ncbi:MAG: hypothetical protein H6767_05265 [Candidatus Peribacteria bacterium]|nr:MAG: hypothetical protein H6767_05265 [Candidatus Peribacteria bacterium]